MRYVAVTDGDKVEAEIKFGYSVNTHGIGDLVTVITAVTDKEIDRLTDDYMDMYDVADSLRVKGSQHQSLREAATCRATLRPR